MLPIVYNRIGDSKNKGDIMTMKYTQAVNSLKNSDISILKTVYFLVRDSNGDVHFCRRYGMQSTAKDYGVDPYDSHWWTCSYIGDLLRTTSFVRNYNRAGYYSVMRYY